MVSASRQAGFTYLGLLFLVAAMGVGLAVVGQVWSTMARRDREEDLLFAGMAIRQAIQAYYDATPGPAKQLPDRLEDLLDDQRSLTKLRHLRRIYLDPMSGTTDWGLIRIPGKGIVGVYSDTPGTPLRRTGSIGALNLSAARSYRDWKFAMALPVSTQPPGPGGAGPGGATVPGSDPGATGGGDPGANATAGGSGGDATSPQPSRLDQCEASLKRKLANCDVRFRKSDAQGLETCRQEANDDYRECTGT